MRTVDILIDASELLNQADVSTALRTYRTEIDSSSTPTAFSSGITTKVNKLMTALNLVIERIASEEINCLYTENENSDSSSEIAYSSFSKPVHEIVKVVDSLTGTEIEPILFNTHLKVEEKGRTYKVTYKYRPSAIDSLDDTIDLPCFVTGRAICFGIVSDILLSLNVFDEAKIWNDKFLSSIALVRRIVRERKF